MSEEDAKNLGAEEIDFAQRHDVKKAFESLEEEEQTIVAFPYSEDTEAKK